MLLDEPEMLPHVRTGDTVLTPDHRPWWSLARLRVANKLQGAEEECSVIWASDSSLCFLGLLFDPGDGSRKFLRNVDKPHQTTHSHIPRINPSSCSWEEKLSWLSNSPPFVEPESSLPCSHEPIAGPYPEPNETSPNARTSSRSILILFPHLRPSLPNGRPPSNFSEKILY
jgi:hypothetical protein